MKLKNYKLNVQLISAISLLYITGCDKTAIVPEKVMEAQVSETMNWFDPTEETFYTVHNQMWNGGELESFYDRLPEESKDTVRSAVWNLSKHAAGLKLVFQTDAEEIVVKYTLGRASYSMNHFPATGVSGVDLFAENNDSTWAWANGTYEFGDTVTYTARRLNLDKDDYVGGRTFHLYLPLYNIVNWLEIGVPTENSFEFIPASSEDPIVVYGTSIAQGATASRAGMAWTNLLNRMLHTPVVNLGFSGNGKLEKEVVDLIAGKNAKIFIFDCMPNLGGERLAIPSKITYAVNTIRSNHPLTPIILADRSDYIENRMDSTKADGVKRINEESWNAYQALKSQGVAHLYYLKHEDIDLTINDSVDGIHPTDGGMLKYAQAYENLIQAILNE